MCNLLNHICFVQSFEPYLLCTIFGTLFALCNLSTPKKVLPTEATTFASLATIYIYRLKFPLCASAFLKIHSHTNPSTTGPGVRLGQPTSFFSKSKAPSNFIFADIFVKNWELGAESLRKESNYPDRECSQIWHFTLLDIRACGTNQHCLVWTMVTPGQIRDVPRKDLSKCKQCDIWGNGCLSVGPVCGRPLDESIPTNCFNYFSLSFSTPDLFHHPAFLLRVSLHLVPTPTVAPALFIDTACTDGWFWLLTNSSTWIKSLSFPQWPFSINVEPLPESNILRQWAFDDAQVMLSITLLISWTVGKCIYPNCKMYLLKLQNVFVHITKYICPNCSMHLFKMLNVFVQIVCWSICPNYEMCLSKLHIVNDQISKCICPNFKISLSK